MEDSFQAGRDEQFLSQISQRTETGVVFDCISNHRPAYAVSHFNKKFVAMLEALEWSFPLDVGEMMIPFKLCNQRNPLRADGKEWEKSERKSRSQIPHQQAGSPLKSFAVCEGIGAAARALAQSIQFRSPEA